MGQTHCCQELLVVDRFLFASQTPKHFSQFVVTHALSTVPTDSPEDNQSREMTSFEISHTTKLTEKVMLDCLKFKTLQRSCIFRSRLITLWLMPKASLRRWSVKKESLTRRLSLIPIFADYLYLGSPPVWLYYLLVRYECSSSGSFDFNTSISLLSFGFCSW